LNQNHDDGADAPPPKAIPSKLAVKELSISQSISIQPEPAQESAEGSAAPSIEVPFDHGYDLEAVGTGSLTRLGTVNSMSSSLNSENQAKYGKIFQEVCLLC